MRLTIVREMWYKLWQLHSGNNSEEDKYAPKRRSESRAQRWKPDPSAGNAEWPSELRERTVFEPTSPRRTCPVIAAEDINGVVCRAYPSRVRLAFQPCRSHHRQGFPFLPLPPRGRRTG